MTQIVSYGTLKSEIAVKMNRTDLTAHMPGFVQRAEQEINRSLRHANNLYRNAGFVITGEWTVLPDDYQELVAVEIGASGERYTMHLDAATYGLGQHGSIVGIPRGFMIADGKLRLSPPPVATTCDLLYFRGVTTITGADAGTNWLMDDHSAVYFYRSLMEAGVHMRDQARVDDYGKAYQGAFESMLRHGRKMRQSSAMRVRVG